MSTEFRPAPRSHELTTLIRVREYLGITDDAFSNVLEVMMRAATDYIEGQLVVSDVMQGGYCNRRFIATTYTLALYTGENFRDLLMRQYPINSITTVIIGDTTEFPSGADTLADQGFYIDNEQAGNIINTGRWPRGDPQNIQITYNAGYTAIPWDLELVALGLIALKWNKKGTEHLKSEKIGNYSYTLADLNERNPFGDDLIKDMLDGYRKPSF